MHHYHHIYLGSNTAFVLTSSQASESERALSGKGMVMKGGVGAGGSGGGDEAWARAGDENRNGSGNGNATLRRERENYRKGRPRPQAGDQHMADIGRSAPVNLGGASYDSLTQAWSPSGITLGSAVSGGADPIPAWLKNLSKQLSDNSYPNFFVSSSNSNAQATPQNGSPPSSPPRLRKRARYSSPPPATPPPSPERASNVLPLPWATGSDASHYAFQTSTPPLMSPVITGRAPGPDPVSLLAGFQISTAAANKAPAYSSFVASGASSLGSGRSASPSSTILPPLLGCSSTSSGASAAGALPLGLSELMTEKDAEDDKDESPELSLGNLETRKDGA